MTANTPLYIPQKSQDALLEFNKQCYTQLNSQWNIRERLLSVDQSYQREVDFTQEQIRAKASNKAGDPTRIQNFPVPVIMPQVEGAVTYQTSVFLTGTPIFGVVASPAFIDEATMMETIVDENATRGGWARELQMFFRDGFKYNICGLECVWDTQKTATLETNLSFSAKVAKPKEVIWEGNCIRRMDMYNTIFDTRVDISKIHEQGEFAGYTQLMSRVRLKEFINNLPSNMNVAKAFESGWGTDISTSNGLETYYIPQVNPDALLDQSSLATTNWLQWAGISGADSRINYKNMYQVTTLYGRIIPQDFNLNVPARGQPQIWKLIIVNNSVVIYVERQTNAHNYLPILFGQPLEDGLNYQTKSLANNVKPVQDISTTLWNSVVAARRRAISDRGIYDPSRITSENINSSNPSAKIPVRPSAYGKNLQEAYFPIPFRDDQSPIILQEAQQLMGFANIISGQNPVRQGQFVKGNKTQSEFNDVMSHANGRDQGTSILLEAQIFTPLKTILKYNILQYQGATSLYNKSKQQVVSVDPDKMRKAVLEFKVSDGLTPTDKLINSDVLMVGMQQIGSSPALQGAYNLGQLFSYLMKTQGADLSPFEKSQEQVAYEQAMMQWQQAVQMIVQEFSKMEGIDYKKLQASFPPQPTPQQFGYDPTKPPAQQNSSVYQQTSILQSVLQKQAASVAPAAATSGQAQSTGRQQ